MIQIKLSEISQCIQKYQIEQQIAQTKTKYKLKMVYLPSFTNIFKLSIKYAILKLYPQLIHNYQSSQLLNLSHSIKIEYTKIYFQGYFKTNSQFQIFIILIVQTISAFIKYKWKTINILYQQIFIIINHVILGIQIGSNCYHHQIKKYIKHQYSHQIENPKNQDKKTKITKISSNRFKPFNFKSQFKVNFNKRQSIDTQLERSLQEISLLKRKQINSQHKLRYRGSLIMTSKNKLQKNLQQIGFKQQLQKHLYIPQVLQSRKHKLKIKIDKFYDSKEKSLSKDKVNDLKKEISKKYILSTQNSTSFQLQLEKKNLAIPQYLKKVKINFKPRVQLQSCITKVHQGLIQSKTYISQNKCNYKKQKLQYDDWKEIIKNMKLKGYSKTQQSKYSRQTTLDSFGKYDKTYNILPSSKTIKHINTQQVSQVHQNILVHDNINDQKDFFKANKQILNTTTKQIQIKIIKPKMIKKKRILFQKQCKERSQKMEYSVFSKQKSIEEF